MILFLLFCFNFSISLFLDFFLNLLIGPLRRNSTINMKKRPNISGESDSSPLRRERPTISGTSSTSGHTTPEMPSTPEPKERVSRREPIVLKMDEAKPEGPFPLFSLFFFFFVSFSSVFFFVSLLIVLEPPITSPGRKIKISK